MNPRIRPLFLIFLLSLLSGVHAATPELTLTAPDSPAVATEAEDEVRIEADDLDYLGNSETVILKGNVIVAKGSSELRADIVTYNTQTEQASARGNVHFRDLHQEWNGEELQYNFLTREGSFPSSTLRYDVFTIDSETVEKVSDEQVNLTGVLITTCDDIENPEFRVNASEASVYEGKIVRIRNAVFFLRGIPFFYLPRYTLDLEREETHLDLVPGYSSRNGPFLLTAHNRYPTEDLRATTRVDYRTERGLALGQDFVWYNQEQKRTFGYIKGYYAMDDAPYRDEEEELRLLSQGVEVPEDRYRLKVMNRKNFTDRDSLFLKGAYLSDARVEQDFFDEDFRENPIPENRVTYSYRGDGFSAGLEVGKQINDEFFGGVSRLPEAYWNVPLTKIGDTALLYEGANRAGLLERTYSDFEEENGATEYDSTRVHTDHTIFYPTRKMGWLNLIPRAGFAYTHYGNTVGSESIVEEVADLSDTNGVSTVTQTNTIATVESGDGRFLPEIGLEASFKAFKALHDAPTSLGRGLRHVVEPFVNYTYIPEPDLEKQNIFQFDRIDGLGDTHGIGFGVRNKWQTKRVLANGRTRIHNYADVVLSSGYDLRSEVDDPLSTIRADAELRPADWVRFEVDVRYDPDESELERIDSEIRFTHAGTGNSLSLDQLYRTDRNHTLQATYRLNPRGRLGLDGYTRFELEDNGVEEQSVFLKYKTDCVGYGLGVRWIAGDEGADGSQGEDDWKVWAQLWIMALPGSGLDMGAR